MMMDVLLEEDENLSHCSPVLHSGDVLLTEQARKLFQMCDHNGKGFVVKMDLARIDGMIADMSQQQLEQFFDNIDISKTNYITENQFIENIKPILLRRDFSDAHPTEIENIKDELHLATKGIGVNVENGRGRMRENEKERKQQERNGNLTDCDEKRADSATTLNQSNSVRISVEPEGEERNKKAAKTDRQDPKQQQQQNDRSTLERHHHHHHHHHYLHHHPHQQHHIYNDFTGSLKDELSVAAIGRSDNEPGRHANAEVEYPFAVENKSPSPRTYDPPSPPTMMEVRQSMNLDDLRRRDRETSSQLDLRKSIYHPDVKSSPGSRSLADELRECGVTNNDAPPSEPRPDFSPDRIFKVVFVGDSAVGKTCFLHRFCHNRFKPLFNATIGVDFTVKTIRVDNRVVAVQLWDTAGQERFRSITKQYFRKADGVILMYDVTSEQSFLNVRNWIASVKAGVEETCVMCLVGNKVDLFANDQSRVLTYKHGQKLAEEFGMLFFETSAFTGYNVNDCMKAVATKLQEREDQQLEEALKLDMSVQTKRQSWCCL